MKARFTKRHVARMIADDRRAQAAKALLLATRPELLKPAASGGHPIGEDQAA